MPATRSGGAALARALVAAAAAASAAAATLLPYGLTADHLVQRNAAGLDRAPLLAWSLAAAGAAQRGDAQAAFRVRVCAAAPPAPCAPSFDSGLVLSRAQSLDLALEAGFAALPLQRYEWSVSVISALDNSSATTSASFVTGILAGDVGWEGAAWVQTAGVPHNRVRRVFSFGAGLSVTQAVLAVAHSGYVVAGLNGRSVADDEWRCRVQKDVSWCSSAREVDAARFAPAGGRNVLSLFSSAAPSALAGPALDGVYFKLRLSVWLSDGSRAELISGPTDAPDFHSGVASWHGFNQIGVMNGAGGPNGIASTWEQGYEEATQSGWDADPDFDEARAAAWSADRAWLPCATLYVPGTATGCIDSVPEGQLANLTCGGNTSSVVTHIDFASFGTPQGACGGFSAGACAANATLIAQVVSAACLGRNNCSIFVSTALCACDPCQGVPKQLSVQATCSGPPPPPPALFDFPTRANPLPTRVVSTWAPAPQVVSPQPGHYTFSLAQNIAGWCTYARQHTARLPPPPTDPGPIPVAYCCDTNPAQALLGSRRCRQASRTARCCASPTASGSSRRSAASHPVTRRALSTSTTRTTIAFGRMRRSCSRAARRRPPR